jgi:ATP-binding cassette, subfamily C, bacteriocin exporter
MWRVIENAPINCLYFLLRWDGKDVTYAELAESIPISDKGLSIVALREQANSFGLNTQVIRARPESLKRCRLPCIAHFEEERGITGSYVVVVEVTATQVRFIEGGAAISRMETMSDFRKKWSGFLLVLEPDRNWSPLYLVAGIMGIVSVGLTFWSRHRTKLTSSTAAS